MHSRIVHEYSRILSNHSLCTTHILAFLLFTGWLLSWVATMKDLQTERFQHLMGNAILELWKKETGSVSSVLIQATICITSATGKVTVVQVDDRLGGSALEDNDLESHNSISHITLKNLALSPWKRTDVTFRSDLSLQAAEEGELTIDLDTHDGPEGDESDLETDIKREPSLMRKVLISNEEDELCDVNHNVKSMPSLNGIVKDSPMPVLKENESRSRPTSPVTSPISLVKRSRSVSGNLYKDHELNPVMDLSGAIKKDSDLALSSPSSYTAQVRDVIRHKLLTSNKLTVHNIADIDDATPVRQSKLKRSESSEDVKPEDNSPETKKTRPSPPQQYKGGPLTLIAPHLSIGSTQFTLPMTPPTASPTSAGYPAQYVLTPSPFQMLTPPSASVGKYPELMRLPNPVSGWNVITPPTDSKTRASLGSNSSASELSPEQADSKQKVYQCEYCSKTFLFKSKYHEHLPVHTNQRPFQCRLCSRTYKYKYDLSVHLRTHMGIPTKSTVCPFCNTKFESNKILRAHITESHNDKVKITDEDYPPLIASPAT